MRLIVGVDIASRRRRKVTHRLQTLDRGLGSAVAVAALRYARVAARLPPTT
jgi:hypothetical protein